MGERGLTKDEIQLIADWVNAGVPQGNPDLEPPLPNFPTGSQLGTPDLVLEMAEEYFIEGNNQDDYRVFVLPTGLTEDKEIAAVEFRPGNHKLEFNVGHLPDGTYTICLSGEESILTKPLILSK